MSGLPDLASDYPLSDAHREQFRANGHVLLRGVAIGEEIAAYRPCITAVVEVHRTETRPLAERDTYGKAFLQIINLWRDDANVRRFVFARRFAKIAAELMGVRGVRLYHDQALYKEPGGGHTPWHQDQYYWPLDTPHTITMWMPLVDVAAEMGTMTFASGSHREGYLSKLPISDESQARYDEFVRTQGFPLARTPRMRAGDATFHAGWTLHSAPGNRTDRMREVMTIIYIADGVQIIEPDNPNRRNDLETWFPGLRPGDTAASEINPLLYSR